ncbi:PLP-dependent aminotransferase family protein [Marinobacter salexigens]|uniref:PLP-dependent aminotransferase family protein n=1 Tax=Marinobacter salexigens TaxID=1925763 RepID=A0ABS6ACJ7_9GAMM|nr:PLP-dependent aminotransferase family protein [Marinobacter salexigens]MBU2875761.1 PLP-dependent aminotransferase family protein [Marinobacter salexigens]
MTSEYRYQALENWLVQGIREHRWRLGERLPSIRTLCQERGLSKATVQHALQRLEAQGLVEARPKAGYFVTLPLRDTNKPLIFGRIEPPRPVTVSELFLDIMRRCAAFDLLPDLSVGKLPPGIVSLNRSIGRALRRQRGEHHQYYDAPAGVPCFREQLVSHYAKRGWAARFDQLCVTSGCQHALFLALMACCNRGDIVAIESPGFYGALQLLEQLGLQVVEVPSSIETGIDTDALEEILARWKVRACIVTPAYATPGGALMPLSAKKRLIELANVHDLAIIEDDIYADTALHGTPDPLKAMDQDERVILCSSFSKSLSRDLRLGWVSGGRWHDRILHLKLVTQLATSRYLQEGVAEYMADGSLGSHLRRQRNELRINRDHLIASLQAWPCEVRVSNPLGGLAIWAELAEHVDTLAAYLPALDRGVVITPGPLFSASGQFRNCLRISYAHPWNNARSQALASLPELLLQR